MSKNPLIRLYRLSSFDRGAKAAWLMTELGLEFETRSLDVPRKEYAAPEFLRLNPMGRVPVLEMSDTVIFESGAICAHLADQYIDRGIAPKPTSADRPYYLQWMYFATSTLEAMQLRIMVVEDIPPGEVQKTKEADLVADLRGAMIGLDRGLTKASYLVANQFSAADICVGYHLYWLTLWPELNAVIQEFPQVTAYLDRLKKMPSAVKADVFSYEG